MDQRRIYTFGIFVFLLAVVIFGRLLSDIPNFTPVAAVAIFAGFLFRSRMLALAVPVLGMAVTDLFVEGVYDYGTMAVVWAALAVPALVGPWLRKPLRIAENAPRWKQQFAKAAKWFVVAGGSAVLFFLTTNFAVWAFGGMYAHTLDGLAICFATAIPFFKLSLAGNLFFVFACFGAYEAVMAARKAQTVERA